VILTTEEIAPPILPRGKFFCHRGNKFFLKAIRLGVRGTSLEFEEKLALRKHLSQLQTAHTTALVISGDEAEAVLDIVAHSGLYALIEIEIPAEGLFSRSGLRAAILEISNKVRTLRRYPGIIGYLLDCPVDSDALRYFGLERLRRRLGRLDAALRACDNSKIGGLKHRLPTAGLTLREEDFVYAIMPPLDPGDFRACVIRLHNLAEDRPVVLELAEELAGRDEMIECAFGLGAAGLVVPLNEPGKQTSKVFVPGSLSLKTLGADELLPFLALNGACPPQPPRAPMVSVVICAYNAERTMRQCLESLNRLDYPNFEVVIVDDGSRDATAQIAGEFPAFRLIRQPNKGLSVARNVGLHAALGDIIAYTDSDCVVDQHWLSFMVRAMLDQGLDACGGPNYAPHEDGWVEGCVAASPGAPSHVLIDDDRAEHLPGCNMVYCKAVLADIGGFDPQFTAAGDDVDICWRLVSAGYTLGYCPSAFVWHFRRNTVRAYYGQQRGYGKAEAMLYFKYPERFNVLGQIKWNGTIPGVARTVPGGGGIRVGWARRTEQFQRVYEAPLSVVKVAPMTPEWTLGAAILLLLSFSFGLTMIPATVALAAGPIWAAYYALRARLDKCHRGPMSRLLITWLAYTGPVVRAIARYRFRGIARKYTSLDTPARQYPTIDWRRRSILVTYWNDTYTARERMLEQIRKVFVSLGRPVLQGSGWNDFDLLVEANPWARIQFKTADEELGGLKLRTNVAARLRLSTSARVGLAACTTASMSAALFATPFIAVVIGIIAAGATICAISELAAAASLAYHAVEQCALELSLVPLGLLTKPPRVATVPVIADTERSQVAQPAGR
jgi:O-antigen biosynthesis protein